MRFCVRHGIIGLAVVLATGLADPAGATRRRESQLVEAAETRPAGLAAYGDCLTQQSACHDL